MRVTTANAFDRAIDVLQRRSADLSDAQVRLTSGKKVARPSDDPTAAARIERALSREARADANQRALESSRNAMTQAESAAGEASDLIQRARELVLQAGNAGYTDSQRRDLAVEIRGVRDQLLQLANRGDGAGGWLFGAQGSASPPFADMPGGVQYRGSQGVQAAAADEPLPLTADGQAAFLQATRGNGVFVTAPDAANGRGAWISAGSVSDPSALTGNAYQVVFSVDATTGATTYDITSGGNPTAVTGATFVDGQAITIDGMSFAIHGKPSDGDTFDLTPSTRDLSVFDVLDTAAGQLETAGRSGAQITQTVQSTLRDLDSSLSSVLAERSRLGVVLNRTDAAENRIADGKLLAQGERSSAEDLDMVQAVSDFSAKQTSYSAALQAYSMVQKLSLFDYIR